MKTIEVDEEVYEKIANMAKPFVETSPNMVIRRILGLTPQKVDNSGDKNRRVVNKVGRQSSINHISQTGGTMAAIEDLRSKSQFVHPAFLTYLMDKYSNTNGNYKITDIMKFMESFNLRLPSGAYRNPWMKKSYGGEKNGLVSCQRTIEHFRQTRKFGCWNGQDVKHGCDASEFCIDHPENPDKLKNKCDRRKGAIWKRDTPNSQFVYGANYLNVIKDQLLEKRKIPLKLLLAVFYPDNGFGVDVVNKFKSDFHLAIDEFSIFFNDR